MEIGLDIYSKGAFLVFADVYESVDLPLRSLVAVVNPTHHIQEELVDKIYFVFLLSMH